MRLQQPSPLQALEPAAAPAHRVVRPHARQLRRQLAVRRAALVVLTNVDAVAAATARQKALGSVANEVSAARVCWRAVGVAVAPARLPQRI